MEHVREGADEEQLGAFGKEVEDMIEQKPMEEVEEDEQDGKPHEQKPDRFPNVGADSSRIKGGHNSNGEHSGDVLHHHEPENDLAMQALHVSALLEGAEH